MEYTQPNRTLRNVAADLEQLASRTDRISPTLPADEAHTLTQEICAIRALIQEATGRLGVLQEKYPERLAAAGQ